MLDVEAKAEFFKLRTPLLSKGRLDTVLAETDVMRVWMKCYAEGGENALHAHTHEDHIFIVLQGKACFYDKQGTERIAERFDGVMLPRGVHYYFQSCGDEPLVMLRVGAYVDRQANGRVDAVGQPLAGDSVENKHEAPVVIPGAFFE